MVLFDTGHRLTHVNTRFCDMLAYTEAELISRTFSEITHPDDIDKDVVLAEQVLQGEIPYYTIGKRYLTKAGEIVRVNLTASVVRDEEGNALYGLGMVENVAERQQKQDQLERSDAQLEAANQELQAFSDTLAQSLKDPLLIVTNFSHHLPEALGEQGADDLERIRVAGRQMVHIVDDLRDLADVSRVEIAPSEVDLSLLAREIIDNLSVQAPDRNVRFEAEPGIKALGDKKLLRLLLTNLLQNAWKYTGPSEDAWIELGLAENEGDVPTYHVRDNGIGFHSANREIIFKAFERLHARTEFSGSGLGLATVERIVRRHGGRVWAEGVPGGGAIFRFTLVPPPIDREHLEPEAPSLAS